MQKAILITSENARDIADKIAKNMADLAGHGMREKYKDIVLDAIMIELGEREDVSNASP
jgi:glycine cleavage system protein P-like pyridoxal-binding family